MTTYTLPIKETLSTAWEKVNGAKGTIIGAFVLIIAVMFVIGIIEGVMQTISAPLGSLFKLIANIIGYLLQMGMLYIGICRAKDMPIRYTLIFKTLNLNCGLRIIGLYILEALIFLIPGAVIFGATFIYTLQFPGATLISAILLIAASLASIYIALRLIPGIALVLDQDAGPITAIQKSWQLTQGNVLNLFVITLVQMLAVLLGVVTFGIGLIWMLPFSIITYGVLYRKLVNRQ